MVSPRVSTGTRDLYILISDINSRIKCILSMFADETKLCGPVDTSKKQEAIWRDLDRLKQWDQEHLMRFNKAKYKVLHLSRGKLHYQYNLWDVKMEHSPAENDLRVPVDGKLDVSQKCALTAQKAKCILGCSKRSVISRLKEVILPFYPELARPHLEYCVQMWSPQYRGDMDLLECIQRKATELIQGMKHLTSEDRLHTSLCIYLVRVMAVPALTLSHYPKIRP